MGNGEWAMGNGEVGNGEQGTKAVTPGRALSREPGVHPRTASHASTWIPGSARRAAPE